MLPSDKRDHFFNGVVIFLLSIFALIILIPLVYILANSVSHFMEVYQGNVGLIPRNIDFTVYKLLLTNPLIIRGFLNTILYTVLGTCISLVLTFFAAYPLSRKDFKHRNLFSCLFLITMFVSCGMIPTYLVVDALGMKNTIWGFILPGCLSVWNLMVARSFLSKSVPWELYEAAKMDGCSDVRAFFQVTLPLSKPIIAIMVLFYGVGYWNSYFNSLLYLTDSTLFPLQRILSDIIIASDISSLATGGSLIDQGRMLDAIQYVSIVVSTLPILLVYPLLSKYIEKGVLLGGIKG